MSTVGNPTHDPAPDYEQASKHLAVIREMIRHEDFLLNQRLTWMWTLQGLLFGATSVMWGKDRTVVLVLGFVGILTCTSIGYSLVRGLRAIKELLAMASDYKRRLDEQGAGHEFPPTIGARTRAYDWLLPGYCLPWVLGLGWVAVILVRVLTPG